MSFSYDGTTEVLHGVSLTIRLGTMTALVGPSGSGKSTVAKLIAGYWDVTSGSITLGGHELKDIPLSEIADQISYVSQDNYLFNRSIRENIRSGGERQRIAIARAMLKNAPVVILDEATSSVDPENEDELQRAIEALTHDKTSTHEIAMYLKITEKAVYRRMDRPKEKVKKIFE